MIRSFRIKQCVPPIAWPCDRKENDTERLYTFYFEQDGLSRESFLAFCRAYRIVNGKLTARKPLDNQSVAIGVRHIEKLTKLHYGAIDLLWTRQKIADPFSLEWPQ